MSNITEMLELRFRADASVRLNAMTDAIYRLAGDVLRENGLPNAEVDTWGARYQHALLRLAAGEGSPNEARELLHGKLTDDARAEAVDRIINS